MRCSNTWLFILSKILFAGLTVEDIQEYPRNLVKP